jgi:two-component system phosphate regulon response regulator OmpR
MNHPASVRILVVDDDPALRALLTDYLAASGFVVDTAGDGVEMHQQLAVAMPSCLT